MIGQMAIAIALNGFNYLGCSVTPVFLLMNHFNVLANVPIRCLNFLQNVPSKTILLALRFSLRGLSNAPTNLCVALYCIMST